MLDADDETASRGRIHNSNVNPDQNSIAAPHEPRHVVPRLVTSAATSYHGFCHALPSRCVSAGVLRPTRVVAPPLDKTKIAFAAAGADHTMLLTETGEHDHGNVAV